jgi:hypothetical protein
MDIPQESKKRGKAFDENHLQIPLETQDGNVLKVIGNSSPMVKLRANFSSENGAFQLSLASPRPCCVHGKEQVLCSHQPI